MSNEKVSYTDLKSEWVQLNPENLLGSQRGGISSLLFELFPDGNGKESPVLQDLTAVYEPKLIPLSPSGLRAKAGDGSVTLFWNEASDPDVRGFRVYYGDEPGLYFGDTARQGKSPIDVGKVTSITLTGLRNGTLYYFAVIAYDSSSPSQISEFSKEVYARPSGIYRGN